MFARLFFAGFFALAMAAAPANAGTPLENLAGTYDGHQTEIGAALQLGLDGRFQYYMSYGAVDEMAKGSWTAAANGALLDSDPMTSPAFVLVDSKSGGGSSFDIALDASGQIPIQFFSAVVFFSDGTGMREEFTDAKLHLKLKRGQSVAAVALLFDIYQVASDKITVPPNTGSMHFRFDPNDLGTVKFDHQLLRQDGGELLLERYDRILRFTKEDGQAADPADAPGPPDPIEQGTDAGQAQE